MAEKHQDPRLDAATLQRIMGLSAVILLAVIGFSYGYWRGLFATVPEPATVPPEPRLQAHAAVDLKRFRAAQQAQLERYAWIDRRAGVAQIPIERAMALLAARGGRLQSVRGETRP